MGLKTKNYELKNTGIIIPEAYAIIKYLERYENRARVVFAVSSSRENALENKVLEEKEMNIEILDRNANPYATAYEKATEEKEVVFKEFDEETQEEKEVVNKYYGIFYGWENDIK